MRDTNFQEWTLLSLLLLVFVAQSECAVGDACKYSSSCGFIDFGYACRDGYCQCNSEYLEYSTSLNEDCMSSYTSATCFDGNCPENSQCIRYTCQCNEGYVKVGRKCMKAYPQEVFQRCYIKDNEAFMCNLTEYSICRSSKCVCFDKFFPNTTSGKCEHQSSYLELHNLTEYRVKPGVYCKTNDHCISGLKCVNFNCTCPSGCTYKSSKEVCDCGELPPADTKAPLIVGCILAILIIIFWYWRIKKTVVRLKEKKRTQTRSFSTVPDESPAFNSYSLTPATSQNTNANTVPPAGLYVNNPSRFNLGADPIPDKVADPNSINFQENTPYPVNPTGGNPGLFNQDGATPYPNDSSQPPPYSLAPTDATLPYSMNPPPVPDPYPSVNPFLSNPSAPLNSLNTSDTPYPINPQVTPQPPHYETENSTAPPAYNSAYKG